MSDIVLGALYKYSHLFLKTKFLSFNMKKQRLRELKFPKNIQLILEELGLEFTSI